MQDQLARTLAAGDAWNRDGAGGGTNAQHVEAEHHLAGPHAVPPGAVAVDSSHAELPHQQQAAAITTAEGVRPAASTSEADATMARLAQAALAYRRQQGRSRQAALQP